MVLLLLIGCACGRTPESAPPAALPSPAAAPASRELAAGSALPLSCEPSALVHTAGGWVMGDNEDENTLFRLGEDMALLDRPPLSTPVEDVEALALLGDALVVVGSHSTNRSGKPKPDRHRILLADGRVFALDLAGFPVADEVNVEGAVGLGGELVLGLRAPLAGTQARLLVVDTGATAGRITRTVPIDLGGAGVRELTPYRGGVLVVSGSPADSAQPFGLWWLASLGAAPVRLEATVPTSAEGAWVVGDSTLRVVIDGDGEPGACKTAGRWMDIPFTPPK